MGRSSSSPIFSSVPPCSVLWATASIPRLMSTAQAHPLNPLTTSIRILRRIVNPDGAGIPRVVSTPFEDLLDDRLDAGGPGEGLGVGVVLVEVADDGVDEMIDAGEYI